MNVILLEKIRNLGNLGDKVKVKPGYMRNYLAPKRKATPATEANLKKFESLRASLEKRAEENLQEAKQRAEKIEALTMISVSAKAAEEGKLYGSVSVADIVEALDKAGVKVERSEVKMPAGAIRFIGEYDLHIYLHSDVTALVKVNVVHE
jgi:large subunit ribosomal protein L9